MSSDDFIKAVKVLIDRLGKETAKGFWLWSVFKGMDFVTTQALMPLVQKVMRGQEPTSQEIEQMRQLLNQITQRQQLTQPPSQIDYDELARRVAEILMQQQTAQRQYAPQPQPSGHQPEPERRYWEERRRYLQQDLDRYRNILADLERQYYLELDATKREELKRRIDEVRQKIQEIEVELSRPVY